MRKGEIGNQKLVRITNQRLIIDAIRKYGPISRAELAKILKLSAPTVSTNIDKLLKKNMLIELGEGDSNGGRKPLMLNFNYDYGYIVSVDLASEEVKMALGNLKAEIIYKTKFNLPSGKDGKKLLQMIIDNMEAMISQEGMNKKDILAISIATPGVMDNETGKIMFAPQFKCWDSIPVKKSIEEHFGVPVIIENDINTAVLGELWYGAGYGYKNLAFVSVDIGIGAGIVINGKLYEGSHHAAGEIGYMTVGMDALNEDYGERGYLESKVSLSAIVEEYRKKVIENKHNSVLDFVNGDVNKIDFQTMVKALNEEDELCISHVKESAKILGLAISNISNILDLELIIIGGKITEFGSVFIESLRQVVNRLTPIKPTIIYSDLKGKTGIYGGFAIALDYVFKDIIN